MLVYEYICDGDCGKKVRLKSFRLAPEGWQMLRILHSGTQLTEDRYGCSASCAVKALAKDVPALFGDVGDEA